MMNLSAEEFARSLSCHNRAFSMAGCTIPLTTLARPQTFSQVIGLTFCAIVDEPTCFSVSNCSNNSAISGLWRFLISTAILSSVVAMLARKHTNSI